MRVGIAGYGNLGRSLEGLIAESNDLELKGIFTRRDVSEVASLGGKVYHISELEVRDDIDVLFLCFGSSTDLPLLAPHFAERFSTVDAFDTHASIEKYKDDMDRAARSGGNVSVISCGWDPGFLSIIRLYASAFLPHSAVNTFWGRGVSQGHSEALRKIKGVRHAIQYTVPRADAITLATLVRHSIDDTDRHRRVCYVVADDGAEDHIKEKILSMENYFAGYQTEIHFVSETEFLSQHRSISHRGRIYALGNSGKYNEHRHSLYLDVEMDSNPDFTASIALCAAYAIEKIKRGGGVGAYTPLDIPPSYFVLKNCKNANNYL